MPQLWPGVAAGPLFLHASIAQGMMGMMFPIVATPFVCAVLVGWATGQGKSQLAWQWTPDAEQMLLQVAAPMAPAAPVPETREAEWQEAVPCASVYCSAFQSVELVDRWN
jgi:hypothetical protein